MVVGSGGIDGVDDVVANGPQGILKHYFRLEWLNCPMLGSFSGGDDDDDGGGGCGGNGYGYGPTNGWTIPLIEMRGHRHDV